MTTNVLRLTNRKAAVKVSGTANDTIALEDLALSNEVFDSETVAVNIQSVTWTGATDSVATISRVPSGTVIMTLQANAAGKIEFLDSEFNESVTSEEDIKVVSDGEMQVYLLLRKESGYASKIDDGLSIYDDPTQPGV